MKPPKGVQDNSPTDHDTIIEGRDFYVENEFVVFTEEFLLRRGTCCGSGCRHCPYGKPKKGEPSCE